MYIQTRTQNVNKKSDYELLIMRHKATFEKLKANGTIKEVIELSPECPVHEKKNDQCCVKIKYFFDIEENDKCKCPVHENGGNICCVYLKY